jgi:hypothetical protein
MRRDAHGISAGLVLLLGGLSSLHAGAQGSSADVRFDALAARFVDEMPAYSPVGATQLGDHRFDSELDQVDDAARAAQSGFYACYRAIDER